MHVTLVGRNVFLMSDWSSAVTIVGLSSCLTGFLSGGSQWTDPRVLSASERCVDALEKHRQRWRPLVREPRQRWRAPRRAMLDKCLHSPHNDQVTASLSAIRLWLWIGFRGRKFNQSASEDGIWGWRQNIDSFRSFPSAKTTNCAIINLNYKEMVSVAAESTNGIREHHHNHSISPLGRPPTSYVWSSPSTSSDYESIRISAVLTLEALVGGCSRASTG